MATRVVIQWEGLETVISNLESIGETAPKNLEKQVESLASATQDAWQEGTPERTGKLKNADKTEPDGLSFTLRNVTRYYDWVNSGHMTPKGWNTRHGYRAAKRRSHVEGREMTSKAVEFIEQNLLKYLSKFLE